MTKWKRKGIGLTYRYFCQGMTLVELVVSVALLLLFFALTIPTGISAMNTIDFLRCISLRNELGQATLLFADEQFGENPPADAILPYDVRVLASSLAAYGVTKDHFLCPAAERKYPGVAGDYHFIPTGVSARALKQIDAITYTLYFEAFDIHGNGRVEVWGDGVARFVPGTSFRF